MKISVIFCGLQEQLNGKPPMILVTEEKNKSTVEFNPKKHYLLNPVALIYALHQAEYDLVTTLLYGSKLSDYFMVKGLLDSILATMVNQK